MKNKKVSKIFKSFCKKECGLGGDGKKLVSTRFFHRHQIQTYNTNTQKKGKMKENNSLRLDSIDAKELKKVYKDSLKLRSIGNIFLLISLVCLGICLYFFKYYFCQYHSFASFKLIIALFSMSICSIAIMYTYKYCLNKNAFKFFLFNSIFCFYYFFPVFSFLITDEDIPIIDQIEPAFICTKYILFLLSLIIFFTIITIGIVPFLDDNSLILEKFSHNQYRNILIHLLLLILYNNH